MRTYVSASILLTACSVATEVPRAASEPPPPVNACGGLTALAFAPGTVCGRCGTWRCATPDTLSCAEEPPNRCGECGALPEEVCNGRDDDCNGIADERCVHRVAPYVLPGTRALIGGIRVSGRRALVLADNEHWNWEAWIHDLESGEGFSVAPHDDAESHDSAIEIDGDLVTFMRSRPNPAGYPAYVVAYYAVDVARHDVRVLDEQRTWASFLDASAGRVAFTRRTWPTHDVVLHTFSTAHERVLTLGASDTPLELAGDFLLGTRSAEGGVSVFARHLESGVEQTWGPFTRVDDIESDGRRAVLVDVRADGERRLVLLDLATAAQAEMDAPSAYAPVVYGDLVCFGGGPEHGDVMVHDVTRHRTVRVSQYRYGGVLCDLSARTLVFYQHIDNDGRLRFLLEDEP